MSGFPLPSSKLFEPPSASAVAFQSTAQLHRPATSLPEKIICNVCGVQPIREGYAALSCAACKRFYYRHRTNLSIGQCKNSGDCENFKMFDGCIPCRFQKCIEVGLNRYPSPPLENTGNHMIATTSLSRFYGPTTSLSEMTICKICGGQAVGKNYGAMSCDACARFYSRHKNNESLGQCENNGECKKIEKFDGCIPCRFQKCIEAGMTYRRFYQSPSQSLENTGSHMTASPSLCKICGGPAAGKYYGALSCYACASFYSRHKGKPSIVQCEHGGECKKFEKFDGCIPCRFQKCIEAGMSDRRKYQSQSYPPKNTEHGMTASPLLCKICRGPAAGKYYGALSCEACGSFYSRHKGKPSIVQCKHGGECKKFEKFDGCIPCRFQKCIEAGMTDRRRYRRQSYPPKNTGHDMTASPPLCKICGGRTAGKYNGALSCYACARFYSRHKNQFLGQYKNGGECKKFEKFDGCIPCRFQKCIEARMAYRRTYQSPFNPPENTANHMPSSSSSVFNVPMPTSSDVVKICDVCGETASGCHYGVQACETCRRFFCEARKEESVGNCDRGGYCRINERCDPCRFRDCLRAGMRQKKVLRISPGYDVVMKILEAYREISEYTEEKIKKNVMMGEYPWTPDKNADEMNNRLQAWKIYSIQMEQDIRSTVLFVRNLQDQLSNEAKAVLLKMHAFPMHLVRITRALNRNGLLLPGGYSIGLEFFNELYGEHLAKEMINFADRALNVFKLDDDGLAMLLTLSFYSEISANDSILHEIENLEALGNLNQEYERNFIEWCGEKKKPGTFSNIQLMLNKLEQLDKLHRDNVINFLRRNATHFDPNTAFAEAYLK